MPVDALRILLLPLLIPIWLLFWLLRLCGICPSGIKFYDHQFENYVMPYVEYVKL